MEIRIRLTRIRLIIGGILVVLLVIVLLLRTAVVGPNAVITNRNTFQSLLVIPKELREFPVEKYIAQGDWFIYRRCARPNGPRHWRLQIVAPADDLQKWKEAFCSYLEPRGKYIERWSEALWPKQPQRMYLRPDSAADASGTVTFKNASGELYITFAFYQPRSAHRLWQTKYGRSLASLLCKIGLPVDTITRPS
jgi:hypothetical protein